MQRVDAIGESGAAVVAGHQQGVPAIGRNDAICRKRHRRELGLRRLGGGGASSGVQPPTSKATMTAAATRTNIPGYSPVAQFGLAPAERNAISA